MKHGIMLCLALAGCASGGSSFAGRYISNITVDAQSNVVIELCDVTNKVTPDAGGTAAAALVLIPLALIGGGGGGGGGDSSRELTKGPCWHAKQRFTAPAGES